MAAAVWTACTKFAVFAEKKMWSPGAMFVPGFCCFAGLFEGGARKTDVFNVVFCGEFVVNRWWKRGFWWWQFAH
jgi:hypothetical protein